MTEPARAMSTPVDRTLLHRFRHACTACATAVVALVAVWWAFVWLIDTSPLIARSPADVYRDLTTGPAAAETRANLLDALGTTLVHAGAGLAAGMIAACLVATLMASSRLAATTIQPVAIALRAVPIVAFAPILTMIFDRGIVVVAVIGGIVTMVPTLYHLTAGLGTVRRELVDVVRSGGGRRRHILWLTQVPTAVPSLALALRVAAPGALVGALLAEWLATGDGLGREMIRGQASFDYTTVWAGTALVTLAGMALYGLASIVEHHVLERWAPERQERVA